MAHITGGGITENLPRVLPRGVAAVIEMGTWPVLPIFQHMQKLGNVPQDEMLRTFNMGIGMVLVVPAKEVQESPVRPRPRRRKSLHHRPNRKRRPQGDVLVESSGAISALEDVSSKFRFGRGFDLWFGK